MESETPGRLPTDRPLRSDDVYETQAETKARLYWEDLAGKWVVLTPKQVEEIRMAPGKLTQQDLARKFGVGIARIDEIRKGGE